MSPRRTRSHQLADESKRAFLNIIPSNWIYRDKQDDYGIDGEVEITDKDSKKTTGRLFYIQLKGTDQGNIGETPKVRLKTDTLGYFNSLEYPVLVVLYASRERKIYTRWIHSKQKKYPKAGQKTFSFLFDVGDEFNESTPEYIERCIRDYFIIRNGTLTEPITIDVLADDESLNGYSISELLLACERFPKQQGKSILNLKKGYSSKSIGKLIITKSKSVLLLGGESASFTFGPYSKYSSKIDNYIANIHIGLAIIFLRLHNHLLGTKFFEYSYRETKILGKMPELLALAIQAFYRQGKYDWIKKVINEVISKETYTQVEFLTAALYRICSEDNKNSLYIIIELLEIQKKFLDENSAQDSIKGSVNYNIGNVYGTMGQYKKSIYYFNQARKLEPSYQKKSYYWRELGGCLFEVRRYLLSSRCYKKAIEQNENDNLVYALYADSLLYSGFYHESLKQFREYLKSTEKPFSIWFIKEFCLSIILEANLVFSRLRDIEKAKSIALQAISLDNEKELDKALEYDLLCSDVWAKYGELYEARNDNEKCLYANLLLAISTKENLNAWVKGFFLSLGLKDTLVAIHIFGSAYFEWQNVFVKAIFLGADDIKDSKNRENFKSHMLQIKVFFEEYHGVEPYKIRIWDENMERLWSELRL